VVSAGLAGMMVGGAIAGWAGDHVGRRTALLSSMVIFSATTIAVSAVSTVGALGWLRFAAGLGLGGALPNAAALAAEFSPRRYRPVAVTVTIVCVPLGAMLAGMLGVRFLATSGWRPLFVVAGVIPLVAALMLWWFLPESPHYLARTNRVGELRAFLRRIGASESGEMIVNPTHGTDRAGVGQLFDSALRGDTLALWGAFFSCLLAVYLGFSWLTTLLTGAGFAPDVASTGITAFNLGGVVGAISGGVLISRIGSRGAMLAMTAGAIAGAVALMFTPLSPSRSLVVPLLLLTLTGGLINAVQTTMYALATNVYPAAVRATGVGTAIAIGRLGAIASGYAGVWAIGIAASFSYFGVMAVAMLACFVALALVQRHIPASR
jgi:AAHS family 4-hydroxybenzoate transporter-like MFS transporter